MHYLYGNSDRCQPCVRCMEGVCKFGGSVMGGSTVLHRKRITKMRLTKERPWGARLEALGALLIYNKRHSLFCLHTNHLTLVST